ncbi:unnamed protein product, partial [Didymodactylos carnosus]
MFGRANAQFYLTNSAILKEKFGELGGGKAA